MTDVFPLDPAPTSAVLFMSALLVLFLFLVALFGYISYSFQHARIEVGPEAIRIAGTPYGRTIPRSTLILDEARIADFAVEPGLRPGMRTNGAGLPGYQFGWFRLKNREKALLFVAGKRPPIFIPTTNGYGLMLTPQDPEGFLAALK